jgi:ATP-binding cassette subfamily C protein
VLDDLRKCLALLPPGGRRRWVALVGLLLFGSVLEGVGLGIMFPFIKLIAAPEHLGEPGLLGRLYAFSGAPSAKVFLMLAAGALLLFFLFKNAVVLFNLRYALRFVGDAEAHLATTMLGAYLAAPYTLHLRRNSAELIRNIETGPPTIFGGTLLAFVDIIAEGLAMGAIFVTLMVSDPLVTLGAAGFLGLFFLGFWRTLPSLMVRLGERKNVLNALTLKTIRQSLDSVKEIKVLHREGFFVDHFRRIVEERVANVRRRKFVQALPRVVIEIALVALLLAAVVAVLGLERPAEDIVALLGLFALAAIRLMSSVSKLLAGVNSVKFGRPPLCDVFADAALFGGAGAGGAAPAAAPAPANPPFAELALVGLGYIYPGAARPSLDDVSLAIRAGESSGLVGRSGAGKSTLADVVLGLLAPTAGEIRLDGRSVPPDERAFRGTAGYVPQSVYLLDDTVRRNVALGVPDAEIDEARIHAAVRLANLEEVLAGLPDGLDTAVGERGVRLSGGQRQRVGIARALYHDPQILVLDEATSALDSETEREVARAIDGLAGRKTMIVIAHRLSTVRHCHRLVFLKDGRVADVGSFDELTARNAEFREMVRLGELGRAA